MEYLKIFGENFMKDLRDIKSAEDVGEYIEKRKEKIEIVYNEMIKENIVHDEGYKIFMESEEKGWDLKEEEKTDKKLFEMAIRAAIFTLLNSANTPNIIFEAKFCPLIRYAYEKYNLIK